MKSSIPKKLSQQRADPENSMEAVSDWWTWGALAVKDQKSDDYHIVDWANHQLKLDHKQPFFLAVGTETARAMAGSCHKKVF